MRSRIVTQANYGYYFSEDGVATIAQTIGEKNGLPSLTVPAQTLSLRALIERYTRGQGVETFQPTYTDDPLIPDNYERMSKIERLEHAREMQSDLVQQMERVRAKPTKAAPDVVLETPAAAKAPDGE